MYYKATLNNHKDTGKVYYIETENNHKDALDFHSDTINY